MMALAQAMAQALAMAMAMAQALAQAMALAMAMAMAMAMALVMALAMALAMVLRRQTMSDLGYSSYSDPRLTPDEPPVCLVCDNELDIYLECTECGAIHGDSPDGGLVVLVFKISEKGECL